MNKLVNYSDSEDEQEKSLKRETINIESKKD
jgi:hypothetical protein